MWANLHLRQRRGTTRNSGIVARSLMIRPGNVATRLVAATTKAIPAEFGNTTAIHRRGPRAARILSTTLIPCRSAATCTWPGARADPGRTDQGAGSARDRG